MSNRLNVAHLAPRREPHEFFAAPARRPSLTAAAVRWLRGLADSSEMALSPALRRDLGLPAAAAPMPFAYEIERSRVRV